MTMRCPLAGLLSCAMLTAPLAAQSGTLVYRLGRDTSAIEQFTRTPTAMTGEMVQRAGATVVRWQYQIDLARTGRPATARFTRMQADGTPFAVGQREVRIAFGRDSVIRETVFADSTQRRAFAATNATLVLPTFVYAPAELLQLLRTRSTAADSLPAVGLGGAVSFTGFTALGGDSVRLRGNTGYPMVLRFDATGRLMSVDGNGTTNKVQATRGSAGLDMKAVAMAMTPTGTLSGRETVRAGFGPGGMVIVDYGRPSVRERSVWGGALVPFDSVWRAGANDATHLFTTRPLTFGATTVAPGSYTLWVQHTRAGTFLIVNALTGVWGTQYDASRDVARIPMQLSPTAAPVEVLQLSVKAAGPTRGSIEIAWGPSVAVAAFAVGAPR
jgi:hypothetical protein